MLPLTPAVRARWWSARQLANRVAGHALSPGAFAEALAAEVLSAVPLERGRGRQTGAVQRRRGESRRRSAVRGRSHPRVITRPRAFAAALERDLDTADAFELDARLCRALRLEARRLARVAALLEDVVAHGLHRRLGFRGLDAYAEERLGMAPSRARALLRVARAARECPPLREAFAAGRLSWVQAHAVVPLLLEPEARGTARAGSRMRSA